MNELVSRGLINLEAFCRQGDVVEGDVEERGLGVEEMSTYLVRSAGKALWQVVDVVGVPARLASKTGDAVFGVASRHVGWKVEYWTLS